MKLSPATHRIGVDLGGTKLEALALDLAGRELMRHRVPTPRDDYQGTVDAIASLVRLIEREVVSGAGERATVGIGIPGTISSRTGMVKNANAVWLNGQPFAEDLAHALDREVRIANDANCLAVSEATDGAAAGQHVVFAAILGTGCGSGIAIDGHVHEGRNRIAGEWGHNPLPSMTPEEYPGDLCYCGKHGCLEGWISGTGLGADHLRVTGKAMNGAQVVAAAEAGDAAGAATLERYEDRLARGLSHVINLLDPDVIVFGGGVSHIDRLYKNVPLLLPKYIFGREVDTPIFKAKHGDSSGVRGAAWLWPPA